MRSLKEEQEAFSRLFKQTSVPMNRAENAEDDLLAEGCNKDSVDSVLRPYKPKPFDKAAPVVCVLYRGSISMSGNDVCECAGCASLIQHRPNVPKEIRKLCVFCVLDSIDKQIH